MRAGSRRVSGWGCLWVSESVCVCVCVVSHCGQFAATTSINFELGWIRVRLAGCDADLC